MCQAKCAYPVDIVTERVKGTIKPQQSILLEVPEFDEPLLHVRRLHSSVPRVVRLHHEHSKPHLLTQGYFYPRQNPKPLRRNVHQVIHQGTDLFPFAQDRTTVVRRDLKNVKKFEDQFSLQQSNVMQR